jgi:O-antigen/teichoic acid export membrane protein
LIKILKIKQLLTAQKSLVLIDQLVVSGSSFITNIFLARILGANNYGMFALAGLIQMFCLSVSMSFFSQIFQVTYPNLADSRKSIYTSSILIIKAAAMFLLFIIGLIVFKISTLYFKDYSTLILCLTITTPLFLIQDFLRRILITSQLFANALLADLTTNFLQMLLLFLCWQINVLNIYTALYIVGLTFIPSVVLSIKMLKFSNINQQNLWYAWHIHRQKSIWLILSALLQWSSGYFFIIIAGWWIGGAAMGALRLAQYIFGLLNVLFQAIENYALPKAVMVENKWDFFKQMVSKMLLFFVPILILLALTANQLFAFAGGASYQGFEYVVYGLCIVYLIIVVGYPIRIILRSLQLNRDYFVGYLLSAVFSICSAFVLLQKYQLLGVIAGLIITQIISNSYWIFSVKRKMANLILVMPNSN